MDILVGNGNIGWEYWMGILDGRDTEHLGGLGLGPIRKLVCNGKEALFLAFLERFQYLYWKVIDLLKENRYIEG
jgi:hypothetical protein